MEEVIKNILNWTINNLTLVIVVFLIFFEITPIKISPIKSLLKFIGRLVNQDVKDDIKKIDDRISQIENKVNDIETNNDINEMDSIRWSILNFANSCRNGTHHTKDEFEHVIKQESKYRKLLEKTHTENGVFNEEYKYILEIYHECQRNNTFL